MTTESICVCGHPESEHYQYILNGRDQARCHLCDPHRNLRGDQLVRTMVLGTAESDMYFYADHDFEPQQ